MTVITSVGHGDVGIMAIQESSGHTGIAEYLFQGTHYINIYTGICNMCQYQITKRLSAL